MTSKVEQQILICSSELEGEYRKQNHNEHVCKLHASYFVYFQIFTDVHFVSVQCKIGWAGDGRVCGPDRDLDSWPDYDLGCADAKCRKVRAALE